MMQGACMGVACHSYLLRATAKPQVQVDRHTE